MSGVDLAGGAIRHVLYPALVAKNRSSRLRYLTQLERSQFESAAQLSERQGQLLAKLLAHAYETVPYYRRKYEAAGVSSHAVDSASGITALPMISKREIQEHRAEMISSRYRPEQLFRDMTGGSTGSPMEFHYDADRLDSRVAATLRHNRWAGWRIGDKAAVLWGAPQDMRRATRLKDRLREWIEDRRIILDASALDEAAMAEFARRLERYCPRVLQAYANTLGLFARFVEANRITGIRPLGIVCSAEVLTEENRQLIERTFGCPVFNRYGCREFAVIASECEAHRGMHVNAENLLVEALPDGELVVTDLRNLAMPMIRYRIGDVGRLLPEPCVCGRGLPLMELSGGRVTDFLRAINGSRVSGIVIATYVTTGIPGIGQIQFVQERVGAVKVNLVRGGGWSTQTIPELETRIRKYLGPEMQIEVEFREHIPSGKAGKYRFSISTLENAP